MRKPRRLRMRRGWFKRGLVMIVAMTVILAGLLVGGVRLLDHFAPQYRNALVDRIGQRIDADIHVDGLSLGWGWHGPILYLDDVRITHHAADTPALTADRLGFAFSYATLAAGKRLPDGFILDAPAITLLQRDGGLQIAHWPAGDAGPPLTLERLQALRSNIRSVTVDDGRLTVLADRLPEGRGVWQDIDFEATNGLNQTLLARFSADGPTWLSRLQARLRVRGALDTDPEADFHAEIGRLRPLALARPDTDSNNTAALAGGLARLGLEGHWQDHQLVDTRLAVDAEPIHRQDADTPLIPGFQAVFGLASDAMARHVTARLMRLSGAVAENGQPQAQARLDTRKPALHIEARDLPGPLALRLAQQALPRLAETRVSGDITRIRLDWQPDTPLALGLAFADLIVRDDQLAFGPVSGAYKQQAEEHALSLDNAAGTLAAPRYLNDTLAISDLSGTVRWQPAPDGGTAVTLDSLALASREARARLDGRIALSPNTAPTVDLTAELSAPNIPRLLHRLPQGPDLPNPRLREWLAEAITAGTVDSARLAIRGPLDRFPFAEGQGNNRFHLDLSGHGLDVTYKPDWPPMHDARGQLTLDGDTLDLRLTQAQLLGATVDRADIHVADIREPVLELDGRVTNGPSERMLAFLAESPLRDRFGALVRAIEVSGPADLVLDLRLPLKDSLGEPRVVGTITARGDTLRTDRLPGPLTDIRGPMRFTGQGLSADQLTGRLRGVPLTAAISPAEGGGQRIAAEATPSLPADRALVAHYLPAAWLDYVHGPVPLRVAFTLGGADAIGPVEISSDLAGTEIDLPAPLTKAADTTALLSATVVPRSGHISARYDRDLALAIDLNDTGRPRRVVVRVGDHEISPPARDGLWIGGHAGTVDGLGWFDVVRHVLYGNAAPTEASSGHNATPAPPPAADSLSFLGGDVTVDRLNLGARYIAHPHVRAQTMQAAHGWRIDFEGPDSQGQVTWTLGGDAPMRVAGNLRRIALTTEPKTPPATETPASPTDTGADSESTSLLWPDLSPDNLPAMQIYVQHLLVDQTALGEMHLDAHRDDDAWHLDRFALDHGALTGRISADWQRARGLTSADAQAHLEGRGLSRLLRMTGHVSPVQADRAMIDAALSIDPNAAGLELRHLNGDVHIALDDGTLLTVNPGPARLLGLFNLYVLPRRLALNFRDVVDAGLAFDKLRADFDIRNGQAYSDNVLIKTPSANIGISGRIGLATRDYDQRVRIQPQLGSGVALASAVIGGPIVGAVVFAVQELLKTPIEHFSTLSYRLEGSWDNPRIVDPSAQGIEDNADDAASG